MTFALADTNSTNSSSTTSSTTASLDLNQSKIDNAYKCLENKTKSKCNSLSVSDMSLVILAVPSSNVLTECKDALKAKKDSQNCWPSGACKIKDTALAVLALNSLGENTDAAQSWLLNHTRTPTDLIWYLEQDSNEAAQCKISYSGNDYTINVADNKKIDVSAGSCLSLAQSNFWLQISSNCLDRDYSIVCDKDFISTLLYKYSDSPTIYVSSDTKSAPSVQSIDLKINAKCFSTSSTCDYEGSLWATLALLKAGEDVENFIPYVIALGDASKQYFPDAFIYSITSFDDYGTKLIQEQKLGNYWEADSSAYGRFYDTALALLSLKQSSSDQVIKAKNRLLSPLDQSNTGCWGSTNSLRDTAIVLWALTSRYPTLSGTSTTYCSEAKFFCIPTAECPSDQQLGNYFCSGLSSTCCKTENLQSCLAYSGKVCESGEVCTGNERKSTDTDTCCLGECIDAPTGNECENNGNICKDSCSSTQEATSDACDSAQICCTSKTTPAPSSSSWWIWALIIAIIIVLAIIAFLIRDKLKLWWFNFKNKVKKNPKSPPPSAGQQRQYPPRPGFPPFNRPQGRPMQSVRPPMRPQVQQRSLPRPLPKSDDTFEKLKKMSK